MVVALFYFLIKRFEKQDLKKKRKKVVARVKKTHTICGGLIWKSCVLTILATIVRYSLEIWCIRQSFFPSEVLLRVVPPWQLQIEKFCHCFSCSFLVKVQSVFSF